MGLLDSTFACTIAVGTLTACYAPEVRDCTLACSMTDECADGQVCGDDRFCARPEMAGQCFVRPQRDGGTDRTDGPHDEPVAPPDAALEIPPDAPTHGTITVEIVGHGHVVVRGIDTCDSAPPQNGKCMFAVVLDRAVTVDANADFGWGFDKWTTSACPDEKESPCSFHFSADMKVGAKFRRWLDDDD